MYNFNGQPLVAVSGINGSGTGFSVTRIGAPMESGRVRFIRVLR